MGLFKNIKALFTVKKLKNLIQKEMEMDNQGIKSGWKTTEFWGKVSLQLVILYNTLTGHDIPQDIAVALLVSLEGLYVAGRSAVKAAKDFSVVFKKNDQKVG